MKQIGIIAAFLLLFVGIIFTLNDQFNKRSDQGGVFSITPVQQGTQAETPKTEVTQISPTEDMKAPKMIIDKTKKYSAVMKTSAGDIELELYADKTPITVNNFVTLAQKKFYDNVIFPRTIKGFSELYVPGQPKRRSPPWGALGFT